MSKLLLTYYGDDFTGSTDALEQLTLAGIRTALFIHPPTTEQLKAYPNLPIELSDSYHQPKIGSQSSPFSPMQR